DAVHHRQQHLAGVGKHQRVGEVVDVLGGAGEVHEFAEGGQFGYFGQAFLDVVLHRLDVVVGGALDLFHTLGGGHVELVGDLAQQVGGIGADQRYFTDLAGFHQRFQPADFHHDAVTDQAIFAGDLAQRIALGGIAAIDRGQRGQRIEGGHEVSCTSRGEIRRA